MAQQLHADQLRTSTKSISDSSVSTAPHVSIMSLFALLVSSKTIFSKCLKGTGACECDDAVAPQAEHGAQAIFSTIIPPHKVDFLKENTVNVFLKDSADIPPDKITKKGNLKNKFKNMISSLGTFISFLGNSFLGKTWMQERAYLEALSVDSTALIISGIFLNFNRTSTQNTDR